MSTVHTLRRLMLGATLALAAAASALAQPARPPMHIVVPFGAGTTTDLAARYIGKHISDTTGQAVIIDNKPGANGFIGMQYVMSLPADGNNIVIGTNTTHAANLALFKKLPYDPVADFMPISALIVGGVVLTVRPNAPFKSLQELIAYAKKNPGKLTFGAGNSSSRSGGEVLRELAGIDILHVPYKTLPLAITDLMGGQIDMIFGDAPAVMPHVRAGKLKALGVSTSSRMPGYEEIPTIAEQGVPGYEASGWLAAFAPRGTSPAEVERLNKLIVPIMKSAEAAKYFGDNAWKPIPGSEQDLAKFQRVEIDRWARLVKAAGIEPE